MDRPLIASLENCRICSLPPGVAEQWIRYRLLQKGHYTAIDQNFDMPGVGEVPLYLYRDLCDNYYLIHEPV